MLSVTPYLTFNGNCRQAMQFYKDCLGGQLLLQTVGDSYGGGNLPEKMSLAVVQARLAGENMQLLATDMVGTGGLKRGNTISLLLTCSSETELHRCYTRLSRGGQRTYPPQPTACGKLFGGLTDQFGVLWWLHCHPKNDDFNG